MHERHEIRRKCGYGVVPLARGLAAVREFRAALPSMGLDDTARFEIDSLKPKEKQFSQALVLAADFGSSRSRMMASSWPNNRWTCSDRQPARQRPCN